MRRAALAAGVLLLTVTTAGARDREAHARSYRVGAGDTAFSVAWQNGVPWADIAAANGLDPAAALRPGQVLRIPPAGIARPSRPASPAVRLTWPVEGALLRGFAKGARGHDGIDLSAEEGSPVRAAAAGTVIFAGREPRQFGELVVIDHGHGWDTAYGFLSRIAVHEGQRVRAGARIGWSGSTGLAQGEELHFEVRRDNRPVDPLPLMSER